MSKFELDRLLLLIYKLQNFFSRLKVQNYGNPIQATNDKVLKRRLGILK